MSTIPLSSSLRPARLREPSARILGRRQLGRQRDRDGSPGEGTGGGWRAGRGSCSELPHPFGLGRDWSQSKPLVWPCPAGTSCPQLFIPMGSPGALDPSALKARLLTKHQCPSPPPSLPKAASRNCPVLFLSLLCSEQVAHPATSGPCAIPGRGLCGCLHTQDPKHASCVTGLGRRAFNGDWGR